MRETRLLMGMPITVEILDSTVSQKNIDEIFSYFESIDNRFSTYKKTSEISLFNRKQVSEKDLSLDMKEVFSLCEQTKQQTNGYFDMRRPDGTIDPSGIVKGWAIWNAAKLLEKRGFQNFYIDAGGDVQTQGVHTNHEKWRVGIKNPFNQTEIIKVLLLSGEGIATSGTYIRGQHIYNPLHPKDTLSEIVSMTVVGPNIYEADRFATAAFVMQRHGIDFIERQSHLEGYMIDTTGIATYTSGFEKYTKE